MCCSLGMGSGREERDRGVDGAGWGWGWGWHEGLGSMPLSFEAIMGMVVMG